MNLLKPKLILVWILKINVFIILERWIIKKRIIYFLYTCVLEKMMIWSKHPCNNPWDYTLSRVQRLVEFWLQACNMHLNIKNLKNHYLASHYVHIYIDTNIDQRLAQQLHQGLVRSWIKRIRMMCRWIRGTSSWIKSKLTFTGPYSFVPTKPSTSLLVLLLVTRQSANTLKTSLNCRSIGEQNTAIGIKIVPGHDTQDVFFSYCIMCNLKRVADSTIFKASNYIRVIACARYWFCHNLLEIHHIKALESIFS